MLNTSFFVFFLISYEFHLRRAFYFLSAGYREVMGKVKDHSGNGVNVKKLETRFRTKFIQACVAPILGENSEDNYPHMKAVVQFFGMV